jgi:GDP-L-fucose synthase
MPTNLYGPKDNYHLKNSHVIPALIRKLHTAKLENTKSVIIWGSGNQKREFLFVDDMADACIYVMNLDKKIYQQKVKPVQSHINIGMGQDLAIKELAKTIARVVGFKGIIKFDLTKPDGPKRKLMDSTILNNMGWQPKIDLELGLQKTYRNYLLLK